MSIAVAMRDTMRNSVWVGSDSRVILDENGLYWDSCGLKGVLCKGWALLVIGPGWADQLLSDQLLSLHGELHGYEEGPPHTLAAMLKLVKYLKNLFAVAPDQKDLEFLAATPQHVWMIVDWTIVDRNMEASIGAGSSYADGVFFTLKNSSLTVKEKLTVAMEAAIALNSTCGGKLYLEEVRDEDLDKTGRG